MVIWLCIKTLFANIYCDAFTMKHKDFNMEYSEKPFQVMIVRFIQLKPWISPTFPIQLFDSMVSIEDMVQWLSKLSDKNDNYWNKQNQILRNPVANIRRECYHKLWAFNYFNEYHAKLFFFYFKGIWIHFNAFKIDRWVEVLILPSFIPPFWTTSKACFD